MDLVSLNKHDYSIGKLVECNWKTDSLIWTERFQALGDFQLVTQNVNETRKILPERGLCALRHSNEVMWIDSHSITPNSDGVDELTVKGRSLECILMRRIWSNAPYGKNVKMEKKYSVRQAVEVWVWNAICNGTGNDRITTSGTYPAGNQLPNVIVTDSIPPSSDGPDQARKVHNGYVYDQMLTFLSSGHYGIRIIRPNGTHGRKVHIDADGTYNTDSVTDISDLRFDFYKGHDISDKVVFSTKAGHLDSPTYFLSSEQMMTGAYVDGDPRRHYYTDPDIVGGTNTGWNRLDGYADGGSKNDLTQGGSESDADFAARKAASADDFEQSLEDLGLRTVRKDGQHINSVDAQISPNINFKYGKDYHLGDRVMVQGRYGTRDVKWVTEFIRSQDANGEQAFPTLSSTLS
jgi:hypothetical protein